MGGEKHYTHREREREKRKSIMLSVSMAPILLVRLPVYRWK